MSQLVSDNTAIGYRALRKHNTGGNNVAVGSDALLFNTTASNNTAVGYQSLYANTTGSSNAAFVSLDTGHQTHQVGSMGANTLVEMRQRQC